MTKQTQLGVIKTLGAMSLLVCWQLATLSTSDMVLASPLNTLETLIQLARTSGFWQSMYTTLTRLIIALLLGASIGFVLGLWSGRNAYVKAFLEPYRWLLMSIPPVIVVLLAMLWFGMGNQMVIFIAVLLLTPSIYVNTQKGVEQIDPSWVELAQVYKFTWLQRIRRIYIPAISAPLCAALVIICCNGVRVIVLAEVLGASNGLGYELANARGNFDISELYAWVTTSLLLVALLEMIIFQPIQNYLLRWKKSA
ncbi:MAG: ABC transporter permease [Litorilituus sp.]|jgi:NitT/TauT family transport system permease protein|nr:ABC transporter permease [Litorilituus sp.]